MATAFIVVEQVGNKRSRTPDTHPSAMEPVGRESEAHPAFGIIPSPDPEGVLVPKCNLGTSWYVGGAGLRARQRKAARDGRPTNTSHYSSFVVSVRK